VSNNEFIINRRPNWLAYPAKYLDLIVNEKHEFFQSIKNHLFHNEHELSYGTQRFAADPCIVEAWKRLEKGTHTLEDISLMKHELFELKFEGIYNTNYITAHNAAKKAGYESAIEGLSSEKMAEIYIDFLYKFGKNIPDL
jgi:hypothetical protein